MSHASIQTDPALLAAIATVSAGGWAVGVSGGADSVALLHLLGLRTDLRLHVVHLDHELRGDESTADAAFVAGLARRSRLPMTSDRISQLARTPSSPEAPGDPTGSPSSSSGSRSLGELRSPTSASSSRFGGSPELMGLRGPANAQGSPMPSNLSARLRDARFALFRRVVSEQHLQGVILAHHAMDQAETVALRLIRGGSPWALAGMMPRQTVGGLLIERPFLGIRPDCLRDELQRAGISWREDSSNRSTKYRRNAVRQLLQTRPQVVNKLLQVAGDAAALRRWLQDRCPTLPNALVAADLDPLPAVARQYALRRWLAARGVPPDELGPSATDRLLAMLQDAASPSRQSFPGGVVLYRRRGVVGHAT